MIKGEYRCLDCGEFFENKIAAIKHHLETKHSNYELIGTGIILNMKS